MSKIKIMVLDVGNAGVGKFRFRDPHITLQKNHGDEFHVDIVNNPDFEKGEHKGYQAVIAQGSLLMKDELYDLFKFLKKEGLKLIFDLDDYWKLPTTHGMYKTMQKQGNVLVKRLAIADLVTTTTKNLAYKLTRYNKNVTVLPNGVNPKEKQFQANPTKSERVRVGWVGGSSHYDDLTLLRGLSTKLQSLSKPTQMVMAGFDNRTTDPQTGKIVTVNRPIVWMNCEKLFTSNYRIKDKNYLSYLANPQPQQYHDIENQDYKRIWTKPVNKYATAYNEIDIALAPLKDNVFNSMKSQLKVIEAGFHKKPIVASDIYPYQLDIKHGVNGYLVQEKKAHKLFPKFVKKLVNSKDLRDEIGGKLYETVKDKYDINNITKKRAQIYKKIINNG